MKNSEKLAYQLVDEFTKTTFEINELGGPYTGILEHERARFFDDDNGDNEYWHFELVFNKVYKNNSNRIKETEPAYKNHLDLLCRNFFQEVSNEVSDTNNSHVLNMLSDYLLLFKDIGNGITKLTVKKANAFHEKTDMVYLPIDFDEIIKEFIKQRIGHLRVIFNSFYETQSNSIRKILEFIEIKLQIVKDENVKHNSSNQIDRPFNEDGPNLNDSYNLNWQRSKIDLIELIIALHETKSIYRNNEPINQIDLITEFSRIFKYDLLDYEKDLSQAKNKRKKAKAPFLEILKTAFENYCSKKIKINK